MNPDLIASVDSTPIPGPEWLFHVLLVFTFVLHAVFMNLTLGGTLLAFVARLTGGGAAGDPRSAFARRMMGINTYGISLAITTGVAPLLFVQVLYQQYFYTATILIGWVWLTFLILLTVGYYAVYVAKFKGGAEGGKGAGWLGLAALLFVIIAMVHVSVNLIHSQPGTWARLAANPWSILGDPSYWPRLLHFLLAAVGFSAAVNAWWAVRQASRGVERELNAGIARWAWRWVVATVALQLIDGFVLLFVLPRHVVVGLMQGGMGTLLPLGAAVLLAVGLLVMASRVAEPVEHGGMATGMLAAMTLTIAVMAVTRHQVRELYLAPTASDFSLAMAPQWGNFLLFVALLVAALATVGYMVRLVLTRPATGERAA